MLKEFIEAVFRDTKGQNDQLKHEIYENLNEEIEDLVSSGMKLNEAEHIVISKLGSINEFRNNLGLETKTNFQFYLNVFLFILHFLISIAGLIYSLGFLSSNVKFKPILEWIPINFGLLVTYVLISSIVNLVIIIILTSKSKFQKTLVISKVYYILLFLTLPISLFGLVPLLINKDTYILNFFNTRSGSNEYKKVMIKRLSLVFILVLVCFSAVTILRKETLVQDEIVIQYVTGDDTDGVNIRGTIILQPLDGNNTLAQFSSTQYFHYSNFSDEENYLSVIKLNNETAYISDENIGLSENNDSYNEIVLNQNYLELEDDLTIEYQICSEIVCNNVLYYESITSDEYSSYVSKDYNMVWVWD